VLGELGVVAVGEREERSPREHALASA
jgi:hypothetical protein